MATVSEAPLTLKERVEEAVIAIFEQRGWMTLNKKGDRVRDLDALAGAIFEVIKERRASELSERPQVAVLQSELLSLAMPEIDGPSSLGIEDEELAIATHDRLVQIAWSETNTGPNGRVQKLVRTHLGGEGFAILETKMTRDGTKGCYISANPDCHIQDGMQPLKDAMRKLAERFGKQGAMYSALNPNSGGRFKRVVERGMKDALDHAKTTMQLASGVSSENGEE